jgi:hypothetical protein
VVVVVHRQVGDTKRRSKSWGCRVANAGGGGGCGGGLDVRGEILFGGTRAKTSVVEVDQVVLEEEFVDHIFF